MRRSSSRGSGAKVGAAYFVSALASDLSVVRFARYGANYIPRNTPVLADVDDINNNVGFWRPQADFRIPERLSPGFTNFPDIEIETMFEDMVKTFVRYQANIGERAIRNHPDADLVMVYIEQPTAPSISFLLTDRRQGTSPTDPNSIGNGQDPAKVARYASYIRFAYQTADKAVKQIADAAGRDSNIIVVSDHGFAPFHTSVSLTNLLSSAGIDTTKVAIRTSGPAANIYVNLQNREQGGTVDPATYNALVAQITDVVKNAVDPNSRFNYSLRDKRIFTVVETRPLFCDAGTGLCTSKTIGQDFGDVFALMAPGYNFDGIQSPRCRPPRRYPVQCGDDRAVDAELLRAHGHDPELPVMSATFIAAGPQIKDTTIRHMQNIDVAPTIMRILGVTPHKVDGDVLNEILKPGGAIPALRPARGAEDHAAGIAIAYSSAIRMRGMADYASLIRPTDLESIRRHCERGNPSRRMPDGWIATSLRSPR